MRVGAGFGERVQVLHGRLEQLSLDAKVDILISEPMCAPCSTRPRLPGLLPPAAWVTPAALMCVWATQVCRSSASPMPIGGAEPPISIMNSLAWDVSVNA